MIDRRKEDLILTVFDGLMEYNFYFDKKADEDERKIATAIFNLQGTPTKSSPARQVINALMEQLHLELGDICRTDMVKEVFIDVSDIYYPIGNGSTDRPYHAKDDINMTFYTDYVALKHKSKPLDITRGFVCCNTIGRFSRKNKKFYEISNSMLSCCELM